MDYEYALAKISLTPKFQVIEFSALDLLEILDLELIHSSSLYKRFENVNHVLNKDKCVIWLYIHRTVLKEPQ